MDFLNNKLDKNMPTAFNQPSSEGWFGSLKSFIWETVKVVVISLAIIIPVRYFLIQPFYVKGASMEPNFYDQEYLIIDEISYRFREPQRGEIVVFRYPRDPASFFIKRIIGLPGERLVFSDDQVTIYNDAFEDGFVLAEAAYVSEEFAKTNDSLDITLKLDEYFVLGDNRSASLDSRRFGPLNQDAIIGKVWLRGWPVDRFMIFKEPSYGIESAPTG